MVIGLFLGYRPFAVSRGYCGALISEFLWSLGNLFTIAGICHACQILECVLGGLKAHGPLVWSTKHLPEIGSQVLPCKTEMLTFPTLRSFPTFHLTQVQKLTKTEHFFITRMNVSWFETWIKHVENTIHSLLSCLPRHKLALRAPQRGTITDAKIVLVLKRVKNPSSVKISTDSFNICVKEKNLVQNGQTNQPTYNLSIFFLCSTYCLNISQSLLKYLGI